MSKRPNDDFIDPKRRENENHRCQSAEQNVLPNLSNLTSLKHSDDASVYPELPHIEIFRSPSQQDESLFDHLSSPHEQEHFVSLEPHFSKLDEKADKSEGSVADDNDIVQDHDLPGKTTDINLRIQLYEESIELHKKYDPEGMHQFIMPKSNAWLVRETSLGQAKIPPPIEKPPIEKPTIKKNIASQTGKKRGKYICQHCGEIKRRHICKAFTIKNVHVQTEDPLYRISLNSGTNVIAVSKKNTSEFSIDDDSKKDVSDVDVVAV